MKAGVKVSSVVSNGSISSSFSICDAFSASMLFLMIRVSDCVQFQDLTDSVLGALMITAGVFLPEA